MGENGTTESAVAATKMNNDGEQYRIGRGQEKKIARACRARRGCYITLHRKDCSGGDECCRVGRLNLNPSQRERVEKSASHNEKKLDLPFKNGDLERNKSVKGGFIPLIIAAIASSIAGGLIERGIAGAGIVWKHRNGASKLKLLKGGGIHITPYRSKKFGAAPKGGSTTTTTTTTTTTNGTGLYLTPWKKGRGLQKNHQARPLNLDDLKKISAPHKRLLNELFSLQHA